MNATRNDRWKSYSWMMTARSLLERTDSQEDEFTQVLRWRTNQLVQVGFSPPNATELAVRLDVNLHDALALVESGCPPETAARILL